MMQRRQRSACAYISSRAAAVASTLLQRLWVRNDRPTKPAWSNPPCNGVGLRRKRIHAPVCRTREATGLLGRTGAVPGRPGLRDRLGLAYNTQVHRRAATRRGTPRQPSPPSGAVGDSLRATATPRTDEHSMVSPDTEKPHDGSAIADRSVPASAGRGQEVIWEVPGEGDERWYALVRERGAIRCGPS